MRIKIFTPTALDNKQEPTTNMHMPHGTGGKTEAIRLQEEAERVATDPNYADVLANLDLLGNHARQHEINEQAFLKAVMRAQKRLEKASK